MDLARIQNQSKFILELVEATSKRWLDPIEDEFIALTPDCPAHNNYYIREKGTTDCFLKSESTSAGARCRGICNPVVFQQLEKEQ